MISIHASAREATNQSNITPLFVDISIHASAREATNVYNEIADSFKISIHASAREATYWLVSPKNFVIYFNPRLREGGDPAVERLMRSQQISIHASAREATLPQYEGVMYWQFQSTPPRGRRPYAHRNQLRYRYFNPRLREGGD